MPGVRFPPPRHADLFAAGLRIPFTIYAYLGVFLVESDGRGKTVDLRLQSARPSGLSALYAVDRDVEQLPALQPGGKPRFGVRDVVTERRVRALFGDEGERAYAADVLFEVKPQPVFAGRLVLCGERRHFESPAVALHLERHLAVRLRDAPPEIVKITRPAAVKRLHHVPDLQPGLSERTHAPLFRPHVAYPRHYQPVRVKRDAHRRTADIHISLLRGGERASVRAGGQHTREHRRREHKFDDLPHALIICARPLPFAWKKKS